MAALILLALLASAAAAWSTWGRVRWWVHASAPDGTRLWGLGHAGALGVLVGLLLTGGRAPLATALAACLAWIVTSAMTVRDTRAPSPAVLPPSVRRQATRALALAALPVVVGTLAATDSLVAGDGALALLAGWFAADAGAPLWVALAHRVTRPSRAEPPLAADPPMTNVPPTDAPPTDPWTEAGRWAEPPDDDSSPPPRWP